LVVVSIAMIQRRIERRPLTLVLVALVAAMGVSIVTATLHRFGHASMIFDVALTGALAYLLLQRRVFETTREAIDQALESMAESIAVRTADGKVLYTNRPMEGHLNIRAGQALTVRGLADDAESMAARRLHDVPSDLPGPLTSRERSAPSAETPRTSAP